MEELDDLPFFFCDPGKFYYHLASQFMIRFECKEYQSRDIPPLLYFEGVFFPSLGSGIHSVHSFGFAWKHGRARMRSYSGLELVLIFLRTFIHFLLSELL